MRYQAAKNEKAGGYLLLFQSITRLRQGKHEKIRFLRDKDILTMRTFKLELDIGRQKDFNRRTKANVEELIDKVAQYEEEALTLKQVIGLIARKVTLYSICTRQGNREARALLKEEQTQMEQLRAVGQEATERWRETKKRNKEMLTSEEHLRNICKHLNEVRHDIQLLTLAGEQLDLGIHNLQHQLARRLAVVAELRKEFMAVESGKQDDLENVNVVRGILQEHRDRMAFMQKEWRDLSADYAKILKQHAAFTVAIPRAYQENHRLQVCVLEARTKHGEAEAKLDRAVILVHRLQQDFEISMIKCENLLEYCGTVSERRIVDVAAYVDSTLEFMLRSGEISIITKHMVNLENQHREIDRYIEWLQKVVVLDVKLLYREMRWEKLCRYYERIHAELQRRVIDMVRRRNLLFLAAKKARDCGVHVPSMKPEEQKAVLEGKSHRVGA
ncbi:hypothetical protein RvY_00569-2 [Ramazzottius varieornatus]|uniref:Uncharacterized protein n=1 Tax=Ramazzottius varieornatus TaxID=947166 RepID=A0A1D1UNM4_RAMVA|nr:hypothetical protein RvY_00569-2 [Ramazzottius varieornatus]